MFIIIIVAVVIITGVIIISQSASPVSLRDFHPWSLPAEIVGGFFFFLFFSQSHTWKQFLVVWVLCILWIIKGLSCKQLGKGEVLIIINSAKANNILG